jgi:hypothetical protein
MRSGSTISTQENPAPTPTTTEIGDTAIDELFDAGNFGSNFAMFAGGADDFEEPRHYDDAWNNPDPAQQTKWRKAISKEFRDMETRKVWKIIKRSKIPEGRRCVKNRWVWKIKRDGTFRARLVACGYSQIPGVDYDENFAPVINDTTYRILLIVMILWDLKGVIADVETAFLHGDLEHEIYMDIPKGLNAKGDECCLLQKTIYGLVQSARQFYKKLVKVLKILGFHGGYADPCLMTRRNKLGVVFIALYVDDCLCIGNDKAIKDLVHGMETQGFTMKIDEELTDYLSCQIVFSDDKQKLWIGQPHLIKNLEKKFTSKVKGLQRYRTPGTPGVGVTRPKQDTQASLLLNDEEQSLYRSGVGMLLFLVKHTRPDIANPVRELSKVMDGATIAAMKELLRVSKFVLDTKNHGLIVKPKQPDGKSWDLVMYTDSDYAGDKDCRISVTGYILYLCEVAISWKSKGQKSVTLSSSEAEFVALSEAAKEIKFVAQILMSMGIPVKLPIVVRVDNIGAIFMAENVTTSTRTRHVDVRYHFVREFVEDGFIRIIFVRTTENKADIFTKNVTGELYDTHTKSFLGTVKE